MYTIRIKLLAFFLMVVAVAQADAGTLFKTALNGSLKTPPTRSAATIFDLNSNSDAQFQCCASPQIAGLDFVGNSRGNDNFDDVAVNPVATLSEPSAVLLLGIGILLVGYVCRRLGRR